MYLSTSQNDRFSIEYTKFSLKWLVVQHYCWANSILPVKAKIQKCLIVSIEGVGHLFLHLEDR